MDIAKLKIKESGKREIYLDFARELRKLWNTKVTAVPIVIGALGTFPKSLGRGLEELEIGGRAETEVGQNTEKTPGDLRRLAATWSPE